MCGKMRTLHSIWRVPVTCAGDGAGNQTHSLTHAPAPFSGSGRLPLTRRSPFQRKVVFPSHAGPPFRVRSSSPHTPVPLSGSGRLPLTRRSPFQGQVVFPSHAGPLSGSGRLPLTRRSPFQGQVVFPSHAGPPSGSGRLPLTRRSPFQGQVVFPSHAGPPFRGRSSSRRGAASGSEQARQRSPKTSGW